MIENGSDNQTDSFREQIAGFMDKYTKAMGFAEGFTGSLVSDSILSSLENAIKSNNNAMLSHELTSALGGLKEQMSLSELNSAMGALSKCVKAFPMISLASSLYEDWQNGNDYPYNTMKSAIAITAGIIIGGMTSGVVIPAILAGVVGYTVETFWDSFKNKFDIWMGVPTKELKQCVNKAQLAASPLIVDLDGDGVETLGTNSGIYFDHDNDGFAERTGWVGHDDGLLVRDINGNGQIDDGTELFGDNSVLSSGQKAINGFEALKDLDSNQDGFFSSSDTAWNEVKVWRDANSNGIVDENELLTLEQAGIAGINLNYNNSSEVDDYSLTNKNFLLYGTTQSYLNKKNQSNMIGKV